MREMKDSGIEWIGEIPKAWKVEKLCRVVPIITDFVASGSFATINDNVEYLDYPDYAMLVRTADLSGTKDKRVYINKHAYEFLSNSNLFGGEVILSNIGSVGNVYMYEPLYERSSLAPNAIMLNGSKNNRYIYYWFLSPHSNEELKRIGGNAVQLKFNKTQLKQFKIAIPPTEEQQRISAYLDDKCTKIDTIIEKQQTIIEKLKAYKLSLITETVTKGLNPDVKMKDSGVEWIGKIPENWKINRIKYIVDFEPSCNNFELSEKSIITYTPMDCIKNGWFINNTAILGNISSSLTSYQEGDIVMAKVTPCFENGNIAVMENLSSGYGLGSSELFVFRPINIITRYLFYWLQNNIFKQYACSTMTGVGGLKRVSSAFVKNCYIHYPPLEVQKKIASYLDEKCSAIAEAIAKKQALIEKLTEYKKSLIYEVVTGKKEVYNPQKTVMVFCPVGIPTNEEEYAKILLIQKIITRCGKNLKGRIHLMKIFHALEIEMGFSFHSEYTRYTHGPYDKKIEKYESELVRKGWISLKKGKKVEYIVVNSTEYKTDYNRIFSKYSKEINRIIDFFKQMTRTSKAEKVATLLASWNDFLIDGMAEPTDDMIINDVMNNWTDNKKNTPYETWLEILNQMRKAKIVPHGYGRHTIKMED